MATSVVPSLITARPRMAILTVLLVFIISWVSLEAPGVPGRLQRFKPSAQLPTLKIPPIKIPPLHIPSITIPSLTAPTSVVQSSPEFRDSIQQLYKTPQAVDDIIFRDDAGTEWNLPDHPLWTKPLGKKLCIVDIDTRPLDDKGDVLDRSPLDWDTTQPIAAGMLNHYMYATIHGYEYYFIRTDPLPDRAPYWTKPPALSRILKSHDFCIAIDADAIFTHLSLPFEWLLNRWGVVPGENGTSLTMALDPDKSFNRDSKGRLVTNAGFVMAQNNARTHEILAAWTVCPDDDIKYPNCSDWKDPWPAEQRAFADYIRYEFDAPNDVLEVPCTEANGYPESETECMGQFVRHFWIRKDSLLKPGVLASLGQGGLAILGHAHESFVGNKGNIVVKDKASKMSLGGREVVGD